MKTSDNIYLGQDDQTRIADNTVLNTSTHDNTVISENDSTELMDDNQEVAKQDVKAKKNTTLGTKVAVGAGAAAIIGGGVFAASAMSSDTPKESTLAQAATPDQEMTDEQLQDSLAQREDPSKAPDPILHDDVTITEETVNTPAAGTATTIADNNTTSHEILIDENPVGDIRTDVPAQPDAQQTAQDININITVNGESVEVVPQATAETAANIEEPVDVTPAAVMIETPGGVAIAHVDDSLSFNEAFAQAREQVGPGGIFQYHGATYGTYTENEWNELSNDQKAQFYTEAQFDDNIKSVEPDIDVHVTSVGTHMMADGSIANIATVQIDGVNTIMVDGDGDGVIDGAIVDLNGDGVIQENELVDMSDTGLTMDDISAQMLADNNMDMTVDFDANCQV